MSGQTFPLPAAMDLVAAGPLTAELLARRGAPIALDGAAVQRVGAQCVQVLLAARAAWEADGQPFAINHASPELAAGIATLGATTLLPVEEKEGAA